MKDVECKCGRGPGCGCSPGEAKVGTSRRLETPPGYGPSQLAENYRLERMYGKQFEQRQPRPYDLFKLAQVDPLISSYMKMWQAGDMSWEAMLVQTILAQHDTIERIMESERRLAEMGTSTIVVTQCPKCGHAPKPE